jgi:hypothetical protein
MIIYSYLTYVNYFDYININYEKNVSRAQGHTEEQVAKEGHRVSSEG